MGRKGELAEIQLTDVQGVQLKSQSNKMYTIGIESPAGELASGESSVTDLLVAILDAPSPPPLGVAEQPRGVWYTSIVYRYGRQEVYKQDDNSKRAIRSEDKGGHLSC